MSKPKTAGGYIWRIKELEQENLELKQELITRFSELQTMADEADALKAHVERLREEYEEAQCQWGNDYLWQKWNKDAALEETPIQSLAAHDREVAEKVREACVKCVDAESVGAEFNSPLADASNETVDDAITSILNLDLDEVLKDG